MRKPQSKPSPASRRLRHAAAGLLGGLLLCAQPGAQADAAGRVLAPLVVETRGELLLDSSGRPRYERWSLAPLRAFEHIGMLMVLPARIVTRSQIAPLESAIKARRYDYRRLVSTSVINLADATWAVGLMMEGEISKQKKAEPDVHLVIDDAGGVRRALDLREAVIHVLLYDCEGELVDRHEGGFTQAQAQRFIERIDEALRGPSCGDSRS